MKYPHKGTQGLVPKELKEYSRFLQAASIETSYFNDFAGAIVMEKIFNPYVNWIVSYGVLRTLLIMYRCLTVCSKISNATRRFITIAPPNLHRILTYMNQFLPNSDIWEAMWVVTFRTLIRLHAHMNMVLGNHPRRSLPPTIRFLASDDRNQCYPNKAQRFQVELFSPPELWILIPLQMVFRVVVSKVMAGRPVCGRYRTQGSIS